MKILAIDTAASLCAACVYDSGAGAEIGRAVLDIGKGHAEHLMRIIEETLLAAGISYGALDAVAVSVGPGSFTGVRVGVAAARGLALALNIPAVGINTLEALAAETKDAFPGRPVLVATGKRPDSLAMTRFDGAGACTEGPALASLKVLAEAARADRAVLAGDAAVLVAEEAGGGFDVGPQKATADILFYAHIAAGRPFAGKPKPLYLRAPDARPQKGFALPMKDRQ